MLHRNRLILPSWHRICSLGIAGCLLIVCSSASFAGTPDSAFVTTSKRTIVEVTHQLSPPALLFDDSGTLHLAWFEKQGEKKALNVTQITDKGTSVSETVRVNPEDVEPDALHQAPGLAVGTANHIFATWSSAAKSSGAMFAADLKIARSTDGGRTFEPPTSVNDDGQAMNHSFEHVMADPKGNVYLAWLDNRGKDRSGAGAIFACSRDSGKTVGKNVAVDGMACPCCRPIIALAPDGTLWMAWRKTFEGNVRDIVLAKSIDQGKTFSAPIRVRQDGWVFPACPHRGPSLAFDRFGRLYVAWYTEGTDEQPRLLFAVSDDEGKSFSSPLSLHTSTTSLPDQLRMALHPDGAVVAVWEEVTGVRKRTVMRASLDRGRTFGLVQALSNGAKAEMPTVTIHSSGTVAFAWSEHAWPHNRLVVQLGTLGLPGVTEAIP